MSKFILILLGGGLGSISRYYLSDFVQRMVNVIFPVGTLGVNAIGGLLIGIVWAFVELTEVPRETRFFVLTGFLGGFTTFSTYSLETMNLLRDKEYFFLSLNILLNNALSITGTIIGFLVTRWIINLIRGL